MAYDEGLREALVQTEAEEIPPTPCCVSRRCWRPRSRPAASQRNTKAGLLFIAAWRQQGSTKGQDH